MAGLPGRAMLVEPEPARQFNDLLPSRRMRAGNISDKSGRGQPQSKTCQNPDGQLITRQRRGERLSSAAFSADIGRLSLNSGTTWPEVDAHVQSRRRMEMADTAQRELRPTEPICNSQLCSERHFSISCDLRV